MKSAIWKSGFVLLVAAVTILCSVYACRSRHHGAAVAGDSGASYDLYVTTDLTSSGTDTSSGGSDDTVTGGTGTSGNDGSGSGGSGGGDGTASGGTGTSGTDGICGIVPGGPVYSGATFTITNFALVNNAGQSIGDLMNDPVQLDLGNIRNAMQLITSGITPEGKYNRIRITFNKQVQLLNTETCTTFSCTFTGYKEDDSDKQPDVVHCDDPGNPDLCWIDLNGAVQLIAKEKNKVGLHFELKKFIVENPFTDSCTVTMKVSPLHPE